jgi:hypothetical protein
VNSAIVRAAAKGIVLSHDRSLLFENGGHIELTKSWARSLLKRMNMVKRKEDHHLNLLNLFQLISV